MEKNGYEPSDPPIEVVVRAWIWRQNLVVDAAVVIVPTFQVHKEVNLKWIFE